MKKKNHCISSNVEDIKFLIKLISKGHIQKAQKKCKNLVGKYPKSVSLLDIYSEILQRQGKVKEAKKQLSKALVLNPGSEVLYWKFGNINLGLREFEEAINNYSKAIQLNKNYIGAYVNRSIAYTEIEHYEKGICDCNYAIKLQSTCTEAYNIKANIYNKAGKCQQAVKNYFKAIKLSPNDELLYLNLGELYKNMGQTKDAIANFLIAVKINPFYALAYYNLSLLITFELTSELLDTLNKTYNQSAIGSNNRMYLCFALSKAYDDIGMTDKMFNFLEEGNNIRRKELDFNIGIHLDSLRTIKELTNLFLLKKNIVLEKNDTKLTPIFIIGMPRSGTSLVEQIISSHRNVHGLGELVQMDVLSKKLINETIEGQNKNITINDLEIIRNLYIKKIKSYNLPENITYFSDKMPLNFIWVGFILSIFPKAKIINLNRDPMAICWSNYKHLFTANGNGFAYDLKDIAKYYKMYLELMVFWRRKFPDKIYDITYEELVKNQRKETVALLNYCTLDWDENCINFHKNKRVVKTASSIQVRKKIYGGSNNAWKKYEKQLAPLKKILNTPKAEKT